jgi:D-alanyl-D-alanine carboxypeptidase (penicillin-binding protein 5/6)
MMVSGNDAANVLASAAGGQERTAAAHERQGEELGALDTRAVNPHGLDAPGQVSSAYDLALIAARRARGPRLRPLRQHEQASIAAPGGTRIATANKNKLLYRYPGALGIKNGYTNAARASFVGAAERGGRRLVVTLMKADPRVFDEAVKLLDWGFSAAAAAPVGELVQPAPSATPTPTPDGAVAGTASRQTSGTTASAAAAPVGTPAADRQGPARDARRPGPRGGCAGGRPRAPRPGGPSPEPQRPAGATSRRRTPPPVVPSGRATPAAAGASPLTQARLSAAGRRGSSARRAAARPSRPCRAHRR